MDLTASLAPSIAPGSLETKTARRPLDWFLTTEPANLARRHLALVGGFAGLAAVAALAIQLEWLTPTLDAFEARTFGAILSLHGTLAMYFVGLPLFLGVLGHTLLLDQLGLRRVAHPPLARASWHLLLAGGVVVVAGFAMGGTEAGWMFDSDLGAAFALPGCRAAALGVWIATLGVSALCISQAATIVGWWRRASADTLVPEIAWAFLWAALSGLVASALLLWATSVVLLDSALGMRLFDAAAGGDPRVFADLFRLVVSSSQSMLLIASLGTAFGVLRGAGQHGDGLGRRHGGSVPAAAAISLLGITGVFVWAGPTATVSAEVGTLSAEAVMGAIAVASFTVVIVELVRALTQRGAAVDAARLAALAAIPAATLALLTAVPSILPALRTVASRTVLATTQLHLATFALPTLAFLAGALRVWRGTGTRLAEAVTRVAVGIVAIGLAATFGPLFVIGLAGQPFRANAYPDELQVLHVLSFAGTTILLAGMVLAALMLARNLVQDLATRAD